MLGAIFADIDGRRFWQPSMSADNDGGHAASTADSKVTIT